MTSRAFVPASLLIEATDLLTWVRIHAVGNQLDVPGVGLVRILHDVYVLAWRLIEHPICERGACLSRAAELPGCTMTGRDQWDAFWMSDVSPHLVGVDVALAVRTPAGTLEKLVARGGANALVEVMRPGFGPDSDRAEVAATLTAHGAAIEIKLDDEPSPSSALTRLRRNLAFPAGWEQHADRTVDPFEHLCARLAARAPIDVSEHDDGPIEPACNSCGGPVETTESSPWWQCGACGWP